MINTFLKPYFASILTIFLFSMSQVAFSQQVTEEQARKLKETITNVKARIDSIVAQAQSRNPNNLIEDEDNLEDDTLAIPRLLAASSNLFQAGQRADETLFAILAGNFQLAFFRFTQACTATGLARSQVARARFAALAPPTGFLTIFDAQFTDIINELVLLRQPFPTGVGCP